MLHHPAIRRCLARRALAPAALLLAALSGAAHAGGSVFTVNTAADLPDPSTADPTVDVDPFTIGAQVTLRAAVMQANHDAGADTIIVPDGLWKLTLKGADEDAALTGDLDVTDDLTIIGTPADPVTGAEGTILDGKKLKDRLFQVKAGVTLTLQDLTLRNGKAIKGESGGAVHVLGSLTMDHVIVRTCKAPVDGGAIDLVTTASALTLTDVFFFKNTAKGDGGAIDANGGVATITRTTFQKNHATEGGALEVTGAIATLTNVTLTANSAKSDGGAMSAENGSALSLVNVTSCGNTCKKTSGISASDTGGIASNTVLARNVIFDDKGDRNFSGSAGGIISLGGNVDSGTSCVLPLADLSATDPQLLTLGYFGGFTPTCPLDVESPAIDTGTDNGSPETDQRGIPREDIGGVGDQFVECDAGAFEFTAPAP